MQVRTGLENSRPITVPPELQMPLLEHNIGLSTSQASGFPSHRASKPHKGLTLPQSPPSWDFTQILDHFFPPEIVQMTYKRADSYH